MLPADIEKKIESDFGTESLKAKKILEEKLSGSDFSPRVYRCVIVLANKSLAKLSEIADLALLDYRDVIASAEYDRKEKPIADYNQPFKV